MVYFTFSENVQSAIELLAFQYKFTVFVEHSQRVSKADKDFVQMNLFHNPDGKKQKLEIMATIWEKTECKEWGAEESKLVSELKSIMKFLFQYSEEFRKTSFKFKNYWQEAGKALAEVGNSEDEEQESGERSEGWEKKIDETIEAAWEKSKKKRELEKEVVQLESKKRQIDEKCDKLIDLESKLLKKGENIVLSVNKEFAWSDRDKLPWLKRTRVNELEKEALRFREKRYALREIYKGYEKRISQKRDEIKVARNAFTFNGGEIPKLLSRSEQESDEFCAIVT